MDQQPPAPPRAFGGGDSQSRRTLLGVPVHAPRPRLLDRPLTDLEGVGPKQSQVAARIGVQTLGDLLEHLPFDHRDYERRRQVSELAVGEEATVSVEVRGVRVRPTRRRRLTILEVQVADESGPMKALWFNQAYLADQLKDGTRLLLRGRLETGRGGASFRVSEHEIERRSDGDTGRHTRGLVPVYPATEGLSARRLRDMAWTLRGMESNTIEPLPARIRVADRLPGRSDALSAAHWPSALEQAAEARRRLAFEELLLFQLALVGRRRRRVETRAAEQLDGPGPLI